MEVRKVPIGDVIPDPSNPRREFGDLEALADSFELNGERPGEPVNPPVVVADGSVYRIIDGERRWRAMRKRGAVAEMHALVCEGMDEVEAMTSMLATDDKERLTDVERSRGVQMMLLLGVDPERVERAGRLGRGHGARVRKAMADAGERAETMSIGFLLALDECETPEEREALLGCGNDDYDYELERIKARRERRRIEAAMGAAAEACGLDVAGEAPGGASYLCYVDWAEEGFEEALRQRLDALAAEGSEVLAGVFRTGIHRPDVLLYGSPASDGEEPAEDPEQAARRRRMHELLKAAQAAREGHATWMMSHADGSSPAATAYLCRRFVAGLSGFEASCIKGELGLPPDDGSLPPASAAGGVLLYVCHESMPEMRGYEASELLACAEGARKDVQAFVDWVGELAKDGYVPSDEEESLLEECRGYLERREAEEGGDAE